MKDPVKVLLSEIRESLNLEELVGEKLKNVSQEFDVLEKKMLTLNKEKVNQCIERFTKFLKDRKIFESVSTSVENVLYRLDETLIFNKSLLEEKTKNGLDEMDIFYEEVHRILNEVLNDKEKSKEYKKILIKTLTRREIRFVSYMLKTYGEIVENNNLTSNLKIKDYNILKLEKKEFTDKTSFYENVEEDYTEAIKIKFDLELGLMRYEIAKGRVNIKLVRNLLEIVRRMSNKIKYNEYQQISIGKFNISLFCRDGYFLSIDNIEQYDKYAPTFDAIVLNAYINSGITSLEFVNRYEMCYDYYYLLKKYYDLDTLLDCWYDREYSVLSDKKNPNLDWIQD